MTFIARNFFELMKTGQNQLTEEGITASLSSKFQTGINFKLWRGIMDKFPQGQHYRRAAA